MEVKNVYSPTLCLVELALVYRSLGEEDKLVSDLAKLASVEGIEWVTLGPNEVMVAAELRQHLDIDFWNSHYAAVALARDRMVISIHETYDRVPASEGWILIQWANRFKLGVKA